MNRTPVPLAGIRAFCLCISMLARPATGAPSATVTNGQRVYTQSCASCHDAHSNASKVGPGLKGYYGHRPPPSDASVHAIIVEGKGRMSGLSSLSQDQINDLIAYLRTL